ncbi:tight adherence protein B [Parvibaculum indicum]|uniref:type II secretion system F family protein n=1 Tax=Parvibaculum indicum TaxID=562969 RepID=UPI00141F15B1|nr:type II secretion system F family protein [Parvibaculum indicum]NIJ40776.1 tight adherence protein B [Parvibaculum indicum]
MDQATFIIIAISFLVAVGIGGVGLVFVGGQNSTQKRVARVAGPGRAKNVRGDSEVDSGEKRRKQMQETLKGLEEQQKKHNKKLSLAMRLERAGLKIDTRSFHMLSAIVGLIVAAILLLTGFSTLVAMLGGFASAFGVPRWILKFLINRRQKDFGEEFANSIDVIVRGVKAGLPINDCLKIIANEAPDPVGQEFRDLVEGQRVGVSMEQGLLRMYERMPLAEVNFFMIVLNIQQKTGGNLSEALGNLSRVLRDRKKMRGKIKAMSQEAKASAAIIGSLPPGVMGLITLTSPGYMDLLFSTTLGNVLIIGGACWMLCGVLVMKKMIDFKF